jgi:excisionase family DNA binding protein
MTVPELAHYLRIGQDRIRTMIRSGQLQAIDTSGARCARPRWVVLPHQLAAWEQAHAAAPPPKLPRRRKRPYAVDYFADVPDEGGAR